VLGWYQEEGECVRSYKTLKASFSVGCTDVLDRIIHVLIRAFEHLSIVHCAMSIPKCIFDYWISAML
jgi:hypothetical protein